MECVELAPAVRCVARFESESKLHALHTLRAVWFRLRRAEITISEIVVFLRRFPGDTEQIAQTDDKGGRVSRSVWSAWSLLPLSDVWRGSTAGASSTHSVRFARFGFGSAALNNIG